MLVIGSLSQSNCQGFNNSQSRNFCLCCTQWQVSRSFNLAGSHSSVAVGGWSNMPRMSAKMHLSGYICLHSLMHTRLFSTLVVAGHAWTARPGARLGRAFSRNRTSAISRENSHHCVLVQHQKESCLACWHSVLFQHAGWLVQHSGLACSASRRLVQP